MHIFTRKKEESVYSMLGTAAKKYHFLRSVERSNMSGDAQSTSLRTSRLKLLKKLKITKGDACELDRPKFIYANFFKGLQTAMGRNGIL